MAVITPVDYSGMNSGMTKLASAMAGGDPETAMSYAKNQTMARHFQAEADKVNIDNKRQAQFNDPSQVNKLVAALKGGSDADVPAMERFQKTGSLGDGVFQTASEGLFAPLPPPKAAPPSVLDSVAPVASASNPTLLQQAFSTAPVAAAPAKTLPISAEQNSRIAGMTQLAAQMRALGDKAATGDNLTQMQSYFQAMHSGLTGVALQNAINAANKGTQQEFKLGANGVLVNSGSGQVGIAEQGLYNDEHNKIVANNAKDYAAANHSNAQAHEAANGGKWQTMDTTNGLVQVNQQGEVRPLGINKPGQGVDKPLTEFQGKAFAYGTRALDADKLLTQIGTNYSQLATNGAGLVDGIPGIASLANAGLSENDQQVMQAKRNFVNAVLRQESGATISPSEFKNAEKQYFPQPGDKPDVIVQKNANRARVISSFKVESGPAANRFDAPVAATPAAQPTTASSGAFDADKEARYQAWKAKQGAQ